MQILTAYEQFINFENLLLTNCSLGFMIVTGISTRL